LTDRITNQFCLHWLDHCPIWSDHCPSDLAFIGYITLFSNPIFLWAQKTCWAIFAWYTLNNTNAGCTVTFKYHNSKST